MTTSIEQAEAALAAAKSAYMNELERESQRSDGSGAQERRREVILQEFREDVARCEHNLDQAKQAAAAAKAGK